MDGSMNGKGALSSLGAPMPEITKDTPLAQIFASLGLPMPGAPGNAYQLGASNDAVWSGSLPMMGGSIGQNPMAAMGGGLGGGGGGSNGGMGGGGGNGGGGGGGGGGGSGSGGGGGGAGGGGGGGGNPLGPGTGPFSWEDWTRRPGVTGGDMSSIMQYLSQTYSGPKADPYRSVPWQKWV
jgi:hypothetical protein